MPAKPPVTYDADDLPGGDRIVRSLGLEAVGQMEVAARVRAAREHEWDHRVMGVLNFVATYVTETGARILPGQTMAYGWTLFRFVQRTPSLLEVHELEDVFGDELDPRTVPGVDRAIRLGDAANDVMRRNRLTGTSDFPHRGKTAVSCVHWVTAPMGRLFLERLDPYNPDDSGWTVTCGDSAKKHETADLVKEHLAHVAAHRPFIVPYLNMPVGCAVAFDDEGAMVFASGQDGGRRDPANPYDFGPSSVNS
jgi:hypothetical protein